jgi:hypothetical protein
MSQAPCVACRPWRRDVRVDPFLVAGAAALPLTINLADGLGVVGIDASGGGKAFDVVPVLLLGVTVDEFAQGGVGFR